MWKNFDHFTEMSRFVWIVSLLLLAMVGGEDIDCSDAKQDPFWINRKRFMATYLECRYPLESSSPAEEPKKAPMANLDNFQFVRIPNRNQWEAGISV